MSSADNGTYRDVQELILAKVRTHAMRESLMRHDEERHDRLELDDPIVLACVWCQS